jgi:hypothetical protein
MILMMQQAASGNAIDLIEIGSRLQLKLKYACDSGCDCHD